MPEQFRKTPLWETQSRKPLEGGRVPGADGRSLWAYRTIPMGPVSDVKHPQDATQVGSGIQAAFYEFSGLTRLGVARNRMMARRSYRQFHIELVNIPIPFRAEPGSATEYLNRVLADQITYKRVGVFGVPLMASIGSGSWKTLLNSVADTLLESQAPISDFDRDFALVDEAFNRAGLPAMTPEEYRWVNAWWNGGRHASTPTVTHTDHLHFFSGMADVRQCAGLTGDPATDQQRLEDCSIWDDSANRHDFTMASVEDFDLGYTSIADVSSRWASDLVNAGARCVSIRGLIEPPRITRQELAAQRRSVVKNLDEALEMGKMPRAEHQERLQQLQEINDAYGIARKEAPPTLVDTTVTVAFEGMVDDVSTLGAGVVLNPMQDRQPESHVDTMLCSPVRANPHLHDMPCTMVAFSGLPDLAQVGDAGLGDGKLALVGFTEKDHQPVYISSTAHSDENTLPLVADLAATGAGKTLKLQWVAYQWGILGVPQFIIDPKQDSDMSPILSTLPRYREYSMDDMLGDDGGLDPIKLSPDKSAGVALAGSILHRVNPWESPERRAEVMTSVTHGIMYGVQHGAGATGEALRIAERDGIVDKAATRSVWEFLDTYTAFRTLFGTSAGQTSLSAFDGLTYIKVGKSNIQLPQDNTAFDIERAEPGVRISVSLVRMMVRGALMALAGRDGVVHLDEAWMEEKAAPDELDSAGRLARQMRVLFWIYTQRPSGPVATGLGNYVSRFFNGAITDEDEAEAGAMFAKITNPDVVARISARNGEPGHLGPIFSTGADGRKLAQRGSVFYASDIRGRFAPTEVVIPSEFLALAGTSRSQLMAREAARATPSPAPQVTPAPSATPWG